MPDYRNLASGIRSVLQRDNQVLTDEMGQLAQQYAEACRAVNQRLQRCQEFLSHGLCGESIQYAEVAPDLLDLVTVLDLPERPQWDELTALYGLPAAPALQRQVVRALNQAYALHEKVREPLRRHRRLALTRAPLPERLAVMRALARADPQGPWAEDIATFEKARLEEILPQARAALARGDRAALQALAAEVNESPWLAPPDPGVVEEVSAALAHTTAAEHGATLTALADDLQQAYVAQDVAGGRRVRAAWERACWALQRDGVESVACQQAVMLAADALGWLEREDREDAARRAYQAAVSELAEAVESAERPADLEKTLQAVLHFRKGVPADLRTRYDRRLRELNQETHRRWKVAWAWITAAAVLVLTVAGYLFYRAERERRYDELVARAADYLDHGELGSAAELFQDLSDNQPGFLGRERMGELYQRFLDEREKQARRVRALQSALRRARNAPPEEALPLALQEAKALAQSPEEKEEVDALARQRREAAAEVQRTRAEAFRKRADGLRARLAGLQADLDAPDVDGKLRDLAAEANAFSQDATEAGPHAQGLARSVSAEVARLRDELPKHRQEQDLRRRLTAAFGQKPKLANYVKTLKEYTEVLPNRARARGLAKAVKQAGKWLAVEDWGELVRPWLAAPLPKDRATAAERLRTCEAFLRAHPDFADADLARAYSGILAADRSKADRALTTVFQDPLIRDAGGATILVKSLDGRRFYLPSKETKRAARAAQGKSRQLLAYYVSQEGETSSMTIGVAAAGPAPQFYLAHTWDRLAKQPRATAAAWEDSVVSLAKTILSTDELDPILALVLLDRVLEAGATGSRGLAHALEKPRGYLKGLKLDVSVRWMDPDSAPASAVRPSAREALKDFPPLKGVTQAAEAYRKGLAEHLRQTVRTPLGWLSRADGGRWQCNANWVPPGRWSLTALAGPPGDQDLSWQHVGSASAGTVVLDPPAGVELLEGQVVFGRPSQAGE
jgi:hypothetical protein